MFLCNQVILINISKCTLYTTKTDAVLSLFIVLILTLQGNGAPVLFVFNPCINIPIPSDPIQ